MHKHVKILLKSWAVISNSNNNVIIAIISLFKKEILLFLTREKFFLNLYRGKQMYSKIVNKKKLIIRKILDIRRKDKFQQNRILTKCTMM